jgi:hypothetical protein
MQASPSWDNHVGSSGDQVEDGRPHVKDGKDKVRKQGIESKTLKDVP